MVCSANDRFIWDVTLGWNGLKGKKKVKIKYFKRISVMKGRIYLPWMKELRNCNLSPLMFEQNIIVHSCFKNTPFRVEELELSIHLKILKKRKYQWLNIALDLPVSLDRSYNFLCFYSFIVRSVRSFVRLHFFFFSWKCHFRKTQNENYFGFWLNPMSSRILVLEFLPKIFSINQIADSLKCNISRKN